MGSKRNGSSARGPRRDDLDGAGDLLGHGRLGERGVEGAGGETVGHGQEQEARERRGAECREEAHRSLLSWEGARRVGVQPSRRRHPRAGSAKAPARRPTAATQEPGDGGGERRDASGERVERRPGERRERRRSPSTRSEDGLERAARPGGRSGARPTSAPVAATRRRPAGSRVQRSGSVAAPPTATAAAAARSGAGERRPDARRGRDATGPRRRRRPEAPRAPSRATARRGRPPSRSRARPASGRPAGAGGSRRTARDRRRRRGRSAGARRDREEESEGQPPHATNPATRSTTQKAASVPTP